MTKIGIRELRQHASEYLRKVQTGETVEISDRGRPVALMIPVPDLGALDRLARDGRLSTADGDVLDLGPPLEATLGVPLPSDALAQARLDER